MWLQSRLQLLSQMGQRTVIPCRKRKRHQSMRSPSRPRFEYLRRCGLSCRFPPSPIQLWSLRHLRGRYQRRNRDRWCTVSCPPEIFLSGSLWFSSGRGLQTSGIRVLNGRGVERTGTKTWNSPYDASIHKQCLRFSNAPRLRVTLGEYPELGVDKRSGSDSLEELLVLGFR